MKNPQKRTGKTRRSSLRRRPRLKDGKASAGHEPAATPKLTHGKKAARQLGQSKIDGYRGQSEKPIRKRAPESVLKAKAEARAVVAEWQARSDTGHKHVRRNLRKCEHCQKPLPYKQKLAARYCLTGGCRMAAARKRTAEIERNKVFQTAASSAQERSNADQRLYNYCEVAAEMQQSADRIGRDDVIFFATPDGVIVANDGEPMPQIRVTVYARELMPRNVQMQVAGHNWTTTHPDIVELVEAAERDLGDGGVPATVAQIPRTSWELRGSELEQRRRHHADLATLAYLLGGPERRVVIYTIDDEAYLPVELGAALEQGSYWEFRFRGDPGKHDLDGYDYVEPDTTAEDIARYENRRTVLEWADKHQNKPAYSHPDVQKGYFWLGRDDKELAFSDRRRIDPGPRKHKPVEHLFEE